VPKIPESNRYWVEENGEGGSLTITFLSKEETTELAEKYPEDGEKITVLFTSRGKDKDFTLAQIREIGEHLIQIADYYD